MVPPPRLERGLLPPEGNALSTELWGLVLLEKEGDNALYYGEL